MVYFCFFVEKKLGVILLLVSDPGIYGKYYEYFFQTIYQQHPNDFILYVFYPRSCYY